MFKKIISLFGIIALTLGMSQTLAFNAEAATSTSPLTVTASSHVVVMEFEPWFGPTSLTFKDSLGKPFKTTPNMSKIGGGYDSSNPDIITKQMEQIQNLGADAILLDFSNYDGCIFDANFCPAATAIERQQTYDVGAAALKKNVTAIYAQMDSLSKSGATHIKIIPLLGGQSNSDFTNSISTGRNGVQMATDFFLDLQHKYPELSVIYEDQPLMVYYHGAPQSLSDSSTAWWVKTNQALVGRSAVTGKLYTNSITYRHMGGFFDDQGENRTSMGSVSAVIQGGKHPGTGFWSWIDRYNEDYGLYPSYNKSSTGVEAFTASIAAPGKTSAGWGTLGHYAADATLAKSGSSFKNYMEKATELRPTFLMINQWNEYIADQGFDLNTSEDIEPNSLTGFGRYNLVTSVVQQYKVDMSKPAASLSSQATLGYLDVVSSGGVASGWTYDPDKSANSINVQFFINGPIGTGTLIGTVVANAARPDVNQVIGIPGNHGYNFVIPAVYKDGHSHTLYAYGIDTSGSVNDSHVLTNSPKTFTLGTSSSGGSVPKNIIPPPPSCKGNCNL